MLNLRGRFAHSGFPCPLPLYQLSIFFVNARVSKSSYLSKPKKFNYLNKIRFRSSLTLVNYIPTSNGRSDHIPKVIETAHKGGEPSFLQALHRIDTVFKRHTSKLDIRPGSDVNHAQLYCA